jgi:hypothetical protein
MTITVNYRCGHTLDYPRNPPRIGKNDEPESADDECPVCRGDISAGAEMELRRHGHMRGKRKRKTERQPAKICGKAVAILLREIAQLVEDGDSFGGGVEYEATADGNFNIIGVYRSGNRDGGQGLVHLIGMPDPAACAFKEPPK